VLKLIIEDDEGRKTVVPFVREEITIGRQEGNTIRLTERNVSRRHARLMRQNGHVVVEDLGSSNGTRINGERISGQSAVKDGDLIQIGDYDLALQSEAAARARPSPASDEPSDSGVHAEPETEAEAPVMEDASAGAVSPEQRRHSTAIIKMDQVEGNRARKVQELEAEEAPRLVVISAELKGQEYACIKTEMKIGRTDDNDIAIDHRSLSRTHAKLVREENGEWRIIDMQSANGLTVNGESYAQASLNNGDVVELGHVKLRFVGAGEAVGSLGSASRSKLPMMVAGVVVLLGVGIGGAWLLKVGPFKTSPDQPTPPEVTHQQPPEPPPTPPSENPQPPNPAEAARTLQARILSAQKALDEGQLDKAEDTLKGAQNADGSWPEGAQALAHQLAAERKAANALVEARSALDEKDYDKAEKLAALAKGTKASAAAYDKLIADLAKAREAKPGPGTPEPTPTPTPPPPATAAEQAIQETLTSAMSMIKAKNYSEALEKATQCVQLAPTNAECHVVLASANANLGRWDEAAIHYRKVLELDPNHRLAAKIRQNLQNLDAMEKNKQH
jgi:pSer/pThr/pTyr-binding forkhead associated (FHA) protein